MPFDFLKSQRKRFPVVFTLAHVHTWTPFFMEMKTFDPGFGSPKMENVSSYIMFLLLNFQLLRKSGYIESKTHQVFFLMCSSKEFECSLSSVLF